MKKNPCLITNEYVNTLIKRREKDVHKGNCGKVLIAAGSLGMAGAAVLSARGALRAGAGLVRVSIPEPLFPIIHTGVIEATCVSRPPAKEQFSDSDAVVVGPGLGKGDENGNLIEGILTHFEGPVVIDADSLNLLSENSRLMTLARKQGQVIITPHPGEAARLLKTTTAEINGDRTAAVQALAGLVGGAALLKGAGTLVATPDGSTYINTTGNPGMATGGSGDVLSGVIGALAAAGCTTLQAACCGAYLHGLAGDLAVLTHGEYGVIASDIAACIGQAIAKVQTGAEECGI